jgi:hypothetical protein
MRVHGNLNLTVAPGVPGSISFGTSVHLGK